MTGKISAGKLAVLAFVLAMLVSEAVRSAVVSLVLPFGAAYIAAVLLRPVGLWLARVTHIREKTACAVWGFFVCALVVGLITALSGKVWDQAAEAAEKLPEITAQVTDRFTSITQNLAEKIPFLHDDRSDSKGMEILTGAFREAASELGAVAANSISGMVSGFPDGVLSLFIAVAAFLYLIADLHGAGESVRRVLACLLGEAWGERMYGSFTAVSQSVFVYLKSYLILILVTFAELSLAFTLIRVENPLLLALVTALIDALPLFGCGVVLLPWALWCFLDGRITRAAALLVIQLVVTLVRQFLEPKLIGKLTGVHPFVALLTLFAGLKIGGFTGMIAAPVVLMAVMRRGEDWIKKENPMRDSQG